MVALPSYYGITSHEIIMQHRKMSVLHFSASQRRYNKPVLCIPALISRSYILDLSEGASTVQALNQAGYDVYLIDWGFFGDEDADLSLERIVLDYITKAIERVCAHSRSESLTLLGYCMGGTMTLAWSAFHKLPKDWNVVAIAAPFDFSAGGLLAHWCRERYLNVGRIVEVFGTVPAHIVESVFTMLRPTSKTRAALAFAGNYTQAENRRQFMAMDRWANDWVSFPGKAAAQWMRWFYQENRFISRDLKWKRRTIDVRKIKARTLVIAAPGDAIVPSSSTRPLQFALGSKDVTYKEVSGGHIGMVAGRTAKRDLFPLLEEWLRTRSA